jgi:hypothetical protein
MTTRANLQGLRYATDILRLFQKHESLSEKLGIDLKEQRSNLLSSLASYTYLLAANQDVDMAQVRAAEKLADSAQETIKEELLLARELLFGALVQLGAAENRFSWEQKEFADVFAREREIGELERSVRLLLGSRSWHLTKGLRELRARMLGIETTKLLFAESNAKDSIGEIAERQVQYLNYLKELKEEILNSRSWKLTAPLRLFAVKKIDS